MREAERVIAEIEEAFASVPYPGDARRCDSLGHMEPDLLQKELAGKTDWRALDAKFIDQAPALAALSVFLSAEGFRFYLPAYMIAAVNGELESADPIFHLTHGLDDESKDEQVNPRLYGGRTWFDYKECRFSPFSLPEVRAIIAFLKYCRRREEHEFDRSSIDEALATFWLVRLRDLG